MRDHCLSGRFKGSESPKLGCRSEGPGPRGHGLDVPHRDIHLCSHRRGWGLNPAWVSDRTPPPLHFRAVISEAVQTKAKRQVPWGSWQAPPRSRPPVFAGGKRCLLSPSFGSWHLVQQRSDSPRSAVLMWPPKRGQVVPLSLNICPQPLPRAPAQKYLRKHEQP